MKHFYFFACAAVLMATQAIAQVSEPNYELAEYEIGWGYKVVMAASAPYGGDIVIPDEVAGLIPGEVESKMIPVYEIDEGAFAHTDVTSVSIPASIIIIDVQAFYDCQSMRKVYYHGGLEEFNAMNRQSQCFEFNSKYNVSLYLNADDYDIKSMKSKLQEEGHLQNFANGVFKMEEGEISIVPTDVNPEYPENPQVEFHWFLVEGVDEYTLDIDEEDVPKWSYTFNADGEQTSKSVLAPRRTPNATLETSTTLKSGSATIGPLTSGSSYGYKLKGTSKGQTTYAKKGKFYVKKGEGDDPDEIGQSEPEDSEEDITVNVENLQGSQTPAEKLLLDGSVVIRRDGVIYNTLGQEVK